VTEPPDATVFIALRRLRRNWRLRAAPSRSEFQDHLAVVCKKSAHYSAESRQEEPMTRQDIVDLLARRDVAYNHRDVATATSFHADDGVVESLMAGRVEGRGAIGDVYRAFFTAFPDVTVQSDDLIVEGNRAVQFTTVSGTDMGEFMGMPATRRSFRMPVVFQYEFHDGLISFERRLYDFTGLLIQIGMLKAKPA
jgi:steroid delta-isomerase-like uncharacterized protein